jgi:hypothetical protein
MVVDFPAILSTSALLVTDNLHRDLPAGLPSRTNQLEAVVEEVVEEELKGEMAEEELVVELAVCLRSTMDLDVVAVEPASSGTPRRMATGLATVTVARD